jgi:hypothetical protein
MSAPGNSPPGTPSRGPANSILTNGSPAPVVFGHGLAPQGSPGQPPRPPIVERTPARQRVRPPPNVERRHQGMLSPSTTAIHGFHGHARGPAPSVSRVLNLDVTDEDVGAGADGPSVMPLGPATTAPRPMNVNRTPPRVLPPASSELAQALGAPRRAPRQSGLTHPPLVTFSPSSRSPSPNVRTPNRSRRRGRKHSRKQSRKQVRKQKHTRRRR